MKWSDGLYRMIECMDGPMEMLEEMERLNRWSNGMMNGVMVQIK